MRSRSKIQDPKISLQSIYSIQSIHSIQSIRPNLTMPNLDLLLLNCKLQLTAISSACKCKQLWGVKMRSACFNCQCLHISVYISEYQCLLQYQYQSQTPKNLNFNSNPPSLRLKIENPKKKITILSIDVEDVATSQIPCLEKRPRVI